MATESPAGCTTGVPDQDLTPKKPQHACAITKGISARTRARLLPTTKSRDTRIVAGSLNSTPLPPPNPRKRLCSSRLFRPNQVSRAPSMTSNDATPSNPTITDTLLSASYPPSGGAGRQPSDVANVVEEPGGEGEGEDGLGGGISGGHVTIETEQRREAGPGATNAPKKKDEKVKSVDPPETIWPMYLKESEKEDNNLVDNITIYTNGVLVFTGLFGAIVTAFIIESYKQLQPPDSGTTAAVALFAQLTLHIVASSNLNATHLPFPAPSTLDSSAFRPSSSALRVNILWFLSLSLSLSSALGAALMQQWARRYISNTKEAQRAGTVDTQGLIHAYLFLGLQTFRFKAAVEALPALLHASVILFFVGMIDFLFPINKTVAYVLLTFVALGALIYLGLTILPLIWPNSPYVTPLSPVMTYIVAFVGFILYAAILVPEGAIDLRVRPHIVRRRRQQMRSLIIHPITSLLTMILRAAKLVPGEVIRFMKSNFLQNFSTDNLQTTSTKLQLRRSRIICYCRSILTASTWEKLHAAASSHDTVELDGMMWTLVTVMDDAFKLGQCFQCFHFFLHLKERKKAVTVSQLQVMERDLDSNEYLKSYLTSDLQRKERAIAEIRSRLRDTNGLDSSLPPVFRNIALSLKSPDKVEAAPLRERAKSCLDLMRILVNNGMKLYYAPGMPEALSELRQDTDPDLAVSATCTSTLFYFHTYWEHFLAGPADDTPLDEADLKDVKTIWAINAVSEDDVLGAIAFVSFTRSVLPRLKSTSPESVELVWKTFGYDLDASGESVTSTRKGSWDEWDNNFPVGGDNNIGWRPSTYWNPAKPEDFAKLVFGLRRLRTAILDAEWPDPLDADHSIDSLPKPRDKFEKLYKNLHQLYSVFKTDYEALLRAAANPAQIETIAGPSTLPPGTSRHPTKPDLADGQEDSDPQPRSAVARHDASTDEGAASADEREPANLEIEGDTGA